MEFGPLPLAQAEGAILAHSVRLPGGRLRKGTCLGAADLAALEAAGHSSVIAARLGPDDVGEDVAALALARALVPDPEGAGLILQAVGTGRVNLLAVGPGLARIDAARIHAVNATDDAITLATVPEWQRMEAGGMVATVKIIAYSVDKASLSSAEAAAQNALSLARPQITDAVLIETVIDAPASDKGHRVTAERLARLGVHLAAPQQVPHDEAALAEALRATTAPLVLILTASATSDLRDTAPAALRRAGGQVAHYGMPVDPGNLLFLGDLDGRPVVGLPGCARSPALNGADWVLERLICGVPVDGSAILRMGVGGLLKDIPARPRMRHQRD